MNYDDHDTRQALEWFLGFLKPRDWKARVASIDQQLDASIGPTISIGEARPFSFLSITNDVMGWYLYLIDAVLNDITAYEPNQGSRVVPIFKTIGANLDLLKRVKGVEDRVSRLLDHERNQPDAALFELLVALVWSRNDFEVELLAETPPQRSPDIRAVRANDEWFIECKRLNKDSDYSDAEQAKWQAMWTLFQAFLVEQNIPAVLDISFHVELTDLPDNHLVDQLSGKLRLVTRPCMVIDDDTWTVSVSAVNYDAAQEHLSQYCVRYPGDQFNELIAGRRDAHRRFSGVVLGHYERIGNRGSNVFLDEMNFAAGAFWSCDSPVSINRKARDIRRHLSTAVAQLPESRKCAVHVGIETLDGPHVELERLQRMMRSVFRFDPRGKDLRWIYCHMMQSYAPPDEGWTIDETTHRFGRRNEQSPLAPGKEFVVLREEIPIEDGVHWLREPP